MKTQKGKLLVERVTGCVMDFNAADVATTPGKSSWPAGIGVGAFVHTTENWINNGAGGVTLAAITGDYTGTGYAIPTLKSGQGYIQYFAATFAGNQNSFKLGDTAAGTVADSGEVKVGRNASYIKVNTNTVAAANLTTEMAAQSYLICSVYDPTIDGDEKFTVWIYNFSGTQIEKSDTGATVDAAFDFSEDLHFKNAPAFSSMVTESASITYYNHGLVFFDARPTDAAIETELAAFAQDLGSGCPAAWRAL